MATLLLGAAGSAIGGALFGPIGAIAGRMLGTLGGAVLDQTLIGGSRSTSSEGPRLSDLEVMASTEGADIPRLYGRARLAGQVIWATQLQEVKSTQTQSVGGKGGSLTPTTTTTTTYTYYANFAVALCEGSVSRIGRIWADGKLLDTSDRTVRSYLGTRDQQPDPWIEAKQGDVGTPAYRGLAYLVFERFNLTDYGNRLPQITVEVERAVGGLEHQVKAVTLIPGATEFGYSPIDVRQVVGVARYQAESRHASIAESDFEASLEQLLAACPNLERVSLVVTWFGDDLRAGQCTVRPKVELSSKSTTPLSWSVGGLTRALAQTTSRYDGHAAYGGTPADETVVRAIKRLKEAGLKVTLNPFLMMDIPAANTREDPWTGDASQPAYPWRGRITCDPAPGRAGTADGTADCAVQMATLFGSASAGDFVRAGNLVLYTGAAEWSLRRMALHYAHLSLAAGGVEAILIGSEFEALTRLTDDAGAFPAADGLAALAAEVKAVVGAGTLVSYAANWSEYGAQVIGEDVRFPLDAVWSSPSVDFIGIDYYPPFTDWRDGTDHPDGALAATPYERPYLKSRLRAGEAYDWYYADAAAREAQTRAAITDGAYGEPWVYRQKDLWSFWANAHHERTAGVRSESPTAYVPGAKPIRLMEAGCPAVDKGANEPNVFVDAKSSESALPYFSSGQRDDIIQRRMLEAVLATFDPDAGASDTDNPPATLYAGRMVEEGCVFLWTWDARPYPQFPLADGVWADVDNWTLGHWLTGRLGSAPLDGLVATLAADFGIADVDSTDLFGVVEGYVVESAMSARSALEPLARAFAFEAGEEGGQVVFATRGGGTVTDLSVDDLVQEEGSALVSLTRTQESELPLEVTVGFIDGQQDYRQAAVSSRRLVGKSRHATQADLAVVASPAVMVRAADIWLQDLWAGRETVSFALPPSFAALTVGDVVRLDFDGRTRLLEIQRLEDREARSVTARSIEPEVFDASLAADATGRVALPIPSGAPAVVVLDLPPVQSDDPLPLQVLGAQVSPWPGTLAIWRSTSGTSFDAIAPIESAATFGTLLEALPPGPVWRFDRFTSVRIDVGTALLASADEDQVLDGANALALYAEGRETEIIQFCEAELVEEGVYRLSGLLRGLAGTEDAGAQTWPEGTQALLLDATLVTVASGLTALGRSFIYRVGAARRDHGDADVTELTTTVGSAALRPFFPVHLRAARTSEGIALSFIRRTRVDGDGWEALDVPLGEASEAYEVEILNGTEVVRRLVPTTSSLTYAAADELADFGAPQTMLTVRVAQRSASIGTGAFIERTVAL